MASLGVVYGHLGVDPVDGEIVGWIRIARACLLGARRFAGVGVAIPGGIEQCADLVLETIKGRIDKARAESLLEGFPIKFGGRHSFPNINGQTRIS